MSIIGQIKIQECQNTSHDNYRKHDQRIIKLTQTIIGNTEKCATDKGIGPCQTIDPIDKIKRIDENNKGKDAYKNRTGSSCNCFLLSGSLSSDRVIYGAE